MCKHKINIIIITCILKSCFSECAGAMKCGVAVASSSSGDGAGGADDGDDGAGSSSRSKSPRRISSSWIKVAVGRTAAATGSATTTLKSLAVSEGPGARRSRHVARSGPSRADVGGLGPVVVDDGETARSRISTSESRRAPDIIARFDDPTRARVAVYCG